MCSPTGPSGTAPNEAATVTSEAASPSIVNANGTPAPAMATGGTEAAAGASTGMSAALPAVFALQTIQTLGAAYGSHQTWKAQTYVDKVRQEIVQKNAKLSLQAASDQQGIAEDEDKKAEGIDALTLKINSLKTRSAIKVAAGESGVSGTTPNDILADADRIQAAREGILEMNYRSRRRERLAQRRSISMSYLNERAGGNTTYRPNPVNYGTMGLEIAGHGLNTYMDYKQSSREGASRGVA